MRIRKNSFKVLGSHSSHYWFMQPSLDSSKNSIAKPSPPPSAPMKCELNLSPWDVLQFASEQLPDLTHHVKEDTKTSELMENGKKAVEEELTSGFESAHSGSSSLRAPNRIRKKNKHKEEKKESSEAMEGDEMDLKRTKRRNSGSRMKVASDFYYFSTAGSWWGRMRKGPKRSHVVKGKNGKEKDEVSVNGVLGGHDDELNGGEEESKCKEVIRSLGRKPLNGLPLKFL